jgi:hypothetical protein
MTARYRIVHFVPDPFLGGRVPIAALLEDHGRVTVVRVPHLPGPQCLGSRARAHTVQLLLADLETVASLDTRPVVAGPQALFDLPVPVPAGIGDPAAWLAALLAATTPAPNTPPQHRAPPRTTVGYRFFEQFKVAKFVERGFELRGNDARFRPAEAPLRPISHFVDGARKILLLEPIVVDHANVGDEVREVATSFGAYKHLLSEERQSDQAQFIAYVLHARTGKEFDGVVKKLERLADEVVNVNAVPSRERFLALIETVGKSGQRSLV